MKFRLFAAALAVAALAACGLLTGPSDVSSFTVKSVSPAPGSVLTAGTTITITGSLTVRRRFYYMMVYVRDDNAVFIGGNEWGSSGDTRPDFQFRQGVATGSQDADVFAGVFCSSGRTVPRAVFVTSETDLLQYYLNNPGFLVVRNFDWNLIDYQVDIPLNYRCH